MLIRPVIILWALVVTSDMAVAGILFEPYYSFRSTKSLSPDRKNSADNETIKNREEKGIRAGLSIFSLFKIQAAVGQSFTVTTKTRKETVDEYDEIDFSTELDNDPDSETRELKTKETDSRARITFVFDPSFWILIARAKAGVTARQRIVKVFENDQKILEKEPPITYKPHAGVGVGIKWSYNIYAIVEYGFYFYKFPETEPFERSMTLSVGFSI